MCKDFGMHGGLIYKGQKWRGNLELMSRRAEKR